MISRRSRILSLEQLSPEQRREMAKFDSVRMPKGICVNVVIGPFDRDVWPLYLEGGQVWLYRSSAKVGSGQFEFISANLERFSRINVGRFFFGIFRDRSEYWIKRPYVQETLEEMEEGGKLSRDDRREIYRELVEVVSELQKANVVHGHISLSNAARCEGRIVLLDPMIGSVPVPKATSDSTYAPEVCNGSTDSSTDIYGLAQIGEVLLLKPNRDEASLLTEGTATSPGDRPSIEAFRYVFLEKRGMAAPKIIGEGRHSDTPPELPVTKSRDLTFSQRPALAVVLGLAVGLALFKFVAPDTYANISQSIFGSGQSYDPRFSADWSSGDRARIRAVAREAVEENNGAAVNAILDTPIDKDAAFSKIGAQIGIIRTVWQPQWLDEMSKSDKHTALAVALAGIYPEGLKNLADPASLHPAVLMAIAGRIQSEANPLEFDKIPLDKFFSLPDPYGTAFSQLKTLGADKLSDPAAIALASFLSGVISARSIDSYLPEDLEVGAAFARVALILPFLETSEDLGKAFFSTLRDRPGMLGQIFGWFDIGDIAKWELVPSAEKIRLIMGQFPVRPLLVEQYADLLLFPLPNVRNESAARLEKAYFSGKAKEMLAVMASDGNLLTRDQVVSLVSAMHLTGNAANSFMSAWFNTKPNASMVAKLVASRSSYGKDDYFNLEASRYLRKNDWKADTETLKLLAVHPEPLARSLAYARIDTANADQLRILKERKGSEEDSALQALVSERLKNAELK